MKYLFVTNIPSPYRVHFFNALAKVLDFDVLFEGKTSNKTTFNYVDEHEFQFTHYFLTEKDYQESTLNRSIKNIILDKKYQHIIFMNYGYITELYGMIVARRHQRPYSIEIDGAFIKKESPMKRLIKKYVFKKATSIFSPGLFTDHYFRHNQYQGPIHRYHFTSLKEADISNNYYNHPFQDKKTWLFVGRWLSWKGYQDVLDVSKHFLDDTFIMITHYQQIPNLDQLKKQYPNVIFKDFMSNQLVFQMMKEAFALLLPTQNDIWGLVVNEAMSCGLPVITTTTCGAGLTLIDHEKNGFIYDVDDKHALMKYMKQLDDKKFYEAMSKHALIKIKTMTIENMVNDHVNLLKTIGNEETS